jgi:alpha-galactosidase
LPEHIVYGSNNWYYAYGKSTHDEILRDTDILMAHVPDVSNPPYMVIDDCWQANRLSAEWVRTQQGPWNVGNSGFPDMHGLARTIASKGARPGIWIRPLGAEPGTPENRLLAQERITDPGARVPSLDPSIPENLAKVTQDMRQLADWGYSLIKHDWTTCDILGRWGFQMLDGELTRPGWHFADRSRTSAEIMNALYAALRVGAGEALLIGCNTVGHLGAGVFELQRTGDDTSGQEWARTRKMGINTLAFRMPQHNAFFAVDADCVGLTAHVPWNHNAQWLDLLSRSGTPLFVSTAPDALGPEQSVALKRAFAQAALPQPIGEPLDWLHTTCPRRWRFGDEEVTYDWYD